MNIQLTISLLVSDRAETLDRCLASVKPLLRELDSELVIVYTGKEPGTLKTAEQYTTHIIPFTWCNDFSKARNAGLEEAQGEWFLYLDDDEWFEDTGEIIQFFKSGEYRQYQSAEYIQRNYLDWEGSTFADAYVGRMCRRTRGTRFVYPIHENIKPFPGPCKKFGAYVHHFGYIGTKNEEEQAQKSDRNLSLLLERLKKEPASAHLYAQLAQEYAGIRKYGDAIRYCREGLALARKEDRRDSLEMWLQLELPRLLLCDSELRTALEEGEKILASSRIQEVGELNLEVCLVDVCWGLKQYRKGLELVQRYHRCLEYLRVHPEKAMEQNGITATFSSAKIQAAGIFVRGLFFAMELGETKAAWELLSWIPWEDAVHTSSQYGNLEEWKKQYGGQKEQILKAYDCLETDNAYVMLQKAYYAAGQNKMEEAAGYWEACARDCPEELKEQLVRMAVENGFSLDAVLTGMSLEDWNRCAWMLSEKIAIPKLEEFAGKILPELSGKPLFAQRLRQAFLEKQLTQGLLEQQRLTELLSKYCESVIADAGMLYQSEVLEDPDSCILPVKYRFAVTVREALKAMESGEFAGCVPLLKKALHIYPQMSAVVGRLTGYLGEMINHPPRPVSAEFEILGNQVKQMLPGLIENGQWKEAYGVVTQLLTLLPQDLEALRLKQEILRFTD